MRHLALLCGMALVGLATGARGAPGDGLDHLVEGNTAFALRLYGRLPASAGNLIFSPYSISSALAMTRAGARGATAAQMDAALGWDPAATNLHASFHGLDAALEAGCLKGKVEMSVANSLWPAKRYEFLPDFLAKLEANYRAGVEPLDYSAEAGRARSTINAWVAEKTNHKITDIIAPGALNAATRLVLVNAIYFKAAWARPFREKQTQAGDFHIQPGKTLKTPFMNQTGDFPCFENDDLQTLALPYAANRFRMVILLPRETGGLGRLEAKLTPENLKSWAPPARPQKVAVALPKFKMTRSFQLADALGEMGMADAFDSRRADFSGMDGHPHWLYISAVAHKAFIEANEAGTEAAAATAVTMRATAFSKPSEPRVFRADHPFLFLIQETTTGSILFLGRVAEPGG